MSERSAHQDVVTEWLKREREAGYREGFLACREAAAKVAGDFETRWERQWRGGLKGDSHLEGKSDGASEILEAIEALTPGD